MTNKNLNIFYKSLSLFEIVCVFRKRNQLIFLTTEQYVNFFHVSQRKKVAENRVMPVECSANCYENVLLHCKQIMENNQR